MVARAGPGLLVVLGLMTGCGRDPPAPAATVTGLKVLLVGIDGASPGVLGPLLAAGELPWFQQLVARGCHGVLESVRPMYSPALWTEILTGRPREQHGIEFFTAGAGAEQRLVSSNDRRCLALWNLASAAGLRCGFLGFWATWPAEPVRGFMVSDRVPRGRFVEWYQAAADLHLVFPPDLWPRVAPLRVDPADLTAADVAELVELTPPEQQELDAVTEPIRSHGFSVLKFGYAAQRSIENIARELLPEDQPDLAGVFLVAADPLSHCFWHYFRPEAVGREPTPRSRRLGAVIPGIYRHNDRYLAELSGRLDPGTVIIVVSDHGFQGAGGLPLIRPAGDYPELDAALLERDRVTVGQTGIHHLDGLFLAAGGPIRPGVRVRARLVDVVPTVLALLGLPIGRDLPGRVLEEILDPAFLERHPPQRVDPPEQPLERAPIATGAALDESLDLAQLRALGYIE